MSHPTETKIVCNIKTTRDMKANEGRIGYVRIAKPDEVRTATELNVIKYEGNSNPVPFTC